MTHWCRVAPGSTLINIYNADGSVALSQTDGSFRLLFASGFLQASASGSATINGLLSGTPEVIVIYQAVGGTFTYNINGNQFSWNWVERPYNGSLSSSYNLNRGVMSFLLVVR